MSDAFDLYRAEQSRAIDRHATQALEIPAYTLMKRAGEAAWAVLRRRWPGARRIGVACGPGNNGGDGYVLARLARSAGFPVHLVASGPARSPTAMKAAADWAAIDGLVAGPDAAVPGDIDVWVDALLGTGLDRPPEGAVAQLIGMLNGSGKPVLALDVPSGVDADRGSAPGDAVRATATVSFIAGKQGLETGAGRWLSGERSHAPLGLTQAVFSGQSPAAVRYRQAALARWLQPRRREAHKGDHGRVLCIGGDHGFGGAIRLCAEAALRCGSGLVLVATRPAHVTALLAARPEVMARSVDGQDEFDALLEAADVLALGPGLGRGDWARGLWHSALASGRPCVVDADGLNLLAETGHALPSKCVLTPHPGEAARLLECGVADVEVDRFTAAQTLAARFGAVVVLKGPGSIVAAEGQAAAVIDAGNPGMAVGGMGDVLAGVIAGLLAQGLQPWDAAVCGTLLHACAGDRAASEGERGLLALDLMPHIRRLANPQLREDGGT